MTTEIVQQTTDLDLTRAKVKDVLFGGSKVKPEDHEIDFFIEVCKRSELNPFMREIYLIKYDANTPAQYVVGKDAFTGRASKLPAYDGMVAGIIVQRNSSIEYLDGAFYAPNDKLLGGWAKVFRKDRSHPSSASVSITEYSSNQSTWRKLPATMIRKVAVVQALREAFPSEFHGLYDSSEMQQADENIDLVASTGVDSKSVVPETISLPENAVSVGNSINTQMRCPIHDQDWFKGGKMRNYAHPVEGETGPKGGAVWCDQAKVLQDIDDSLYAVCQELDMDSIALSQFVEEHYQTTVELLSPKDKLEVTATLTNNDTSESLIDEQQDTVTEDSDSNHEEPFI